MTTTITTTVSNPLSHNQRVERMNKLIDDGVAIATIIGLKTAPHKSAGCGLVSETATNMILTLSIANRNTAAYEGTITNVYLSDPNSYPGCDAESMRKTEGIANALARFTIAFNLQYDHDEALDVTLFREAIEDAIKVKRIALCTVGRETYKSITRNVASNFQPYPVGGQDSKDFPRVLTVVKAPKTKKRKTTKTKSGN